MLTKLSISHVGPFLWRNKSYPLQQLFPSSPFTSYHQTLHPTSKQIAWFSPQKYRICRWDLHHASSIKSQPSYTSHLCSALLKFAFLNKSLRWCPIRSNVFRSLLYSSHPFSCQPIYCLYPNPLSFSISVYHLWEWWHHSSIIQTREA